MTEKTARQIENMKSQTIGVEVEMNSITRKAAAMLAAGFFGTGRYEHTASRNGYDTWSAWDAKQREWKFQKDVSIKGPDAEKCEMVTPILTYGDIETLQELCRRLRKAGAKSDATRGCGVHIHIGANGHTPKSLRNLANLMASHEHLLADALKLDSYRMGRYCKTVSPSFLAELNRKKPETMAQLADIWYKGNGADYGRSQHYNESRYTTPSEGENHTDGGKDMELKFKRDDADIITGLEPVDRNDPASQHTATGYWIPEGFSEKAKACWNSFYESIFIFEYKGRLVLTDEGLFLTNYGEGTPGSPFGGPRGTFDSWEEVERELERIYDDLAENGML